MIIRRTSPNHIRFRLLCSALIDNETYLLLTYLNAKIRNLVRMAIFVLNTIMTRPNSIGVDEKLNTAQFSAQPDIAWKLVTCAFMTGPVRTGHIDRRPNATNPILSP